VKIFHQLIYQYVSFVAHACASICQVNNVL